MEWPYDMKFRNATAPEVDRKCSYICNFYPGPTRRVLF